MTGCYKQVLFGKTDGKNKIADGQTTWWTGARKILVACTDWRRTEPSGTKL